MWCSSLSFGRLVVTSRPPTTSLAVAPYGTYDVFIHTYPHCRQTGVRLSSLILYVSMRIHVCRRRFVAYSIDCPLQFLISSRRLGDGREDGREDEWCLCVRVYFCVMAGSSFRCPI